LLVVHASFLDTDAHCWPFCQTAPGSRRSAGGCSAFGCGRRRARCYCYLPPGTRHSVAPAQPVPTSQPTKLAPHDADGWSTSSRRCGSCAGPGARSARCQVCLLHPHLLAPLPSTCSRWRADDANGTARARCENTALLVWSERVPAFVPHGRAATDLLPLYASFEARAAPLSTRTCAS
jgi:hypothetical protein